MYFTTIYNPFNVKKSELDFILSEKMIENQKNNI
jgi:hypothetical protein